MNPNANVFAMSLADLIAFSAELDAKLGCHLRRDLTGVWLVDSESFSAVLMKPHRTVEDFRTHARSIADARTQAAA